MGSWESILGPLHKSAIPTVLLHGPNYGRILKWESIITGFCDEWNDPKSEETNLIEIETNLIKIGETTTTVKIFLRIVERLGFRVW